MKFKPGDTLIEVAIAIGIFSLVAISIVSVVNGSTSSAQSALEVTVAREEIDAQAEALRFIHNSYITGGTSNITDNDKYLTLWRTITSRAVHTDSMLDSILSYNPSDCADIYNNNLPFDQKAFIINTRNLGLGDDSEGRFNSSYARNIIVTPVAENANTVFRPASTYPRIIYGSAAYADTDTLLDQNTSSNIYRVEGLYIVAVKDQDTTTIVSGSTPTAGTNSGFYDFYIRTCWFGPGASRPSTISTVIRLQDPGAIEY